MDSDSFEIIKKNYYLDILESYIDRNLIPDSLNSEYEISCFWIRGSHRHYKTAPGENTVGNDMLLLDKCFDIGYIKNQDEILKFSEPGSADYLKIHNAREYRDLVDEINRELEWHISPTQEIEPLGKLVNNGDDCVYLFKVHNVGQALATSLSVDNSDPFIYFDYGMPYGSDATTKPAGARLPVNAKAAIILSHLHKDHWLGIAYEPNAYVCHWYIPAQIIKKQLRHKLAEIIVQGGTVNIIDKDIDFAYGRITCGGVSGHNPGRIASDYHETGLTMRIDAITVDESNENNQINILIAGDQDYDYIDDAQKDCLDILIATHHGRKYSWTVECEVPAARDPLTSIVVYSCGLNKKYSHLLKVADYIAANWNRDHRTYCDGDYIIRIKLRRRS